MCKKHGRETIQRNNRWAQEGHLAIRGTPTNPHRSERPAFVAAACKAPEPHRTLPVLICSLGGLLAVALRDKDSVACWNFAEENWERLVGLCRAHVYRAPYNGENRREFMRAKMGEVLAALDSVLVTPGPNPLAIVARRLNLPPYVEPSSLPPPAPAGA